MQPSTQNEDWFISWYLIVSKKFNNTLFLTRELSTADITNGWIKIRAWRHLTAVRGKWRLKFSELICGYRSHLKLKKYKFTHYLHICMLSLLMYVILITQIKIYLRPLCSRWQKKSSGVWMWATTPQNSSPTFKVNTLGIRPLLSITILFSAVIFLTSSRSPYQKAEI